MSAPRRLTAGAKLLASVALTPAVIAYGIALCTMHPYIGGTVVAYGCIWAFVGGIMGAFWCSDDGLVTTKYRQSLRAATYKIERLERRLSEETALREKFQTALTDGSEARR